MVVEALIGESAVAAAVTGGPTRNLAGHGQGTGAQHLVPVLTKPTRSALPCWSRSCTLTGCAGWQAVQLTPASFSPPPTEMRVTRLDGWQAVLASPRFEGDTHTRPTGGRALRLDRDAGIASTERGGADCGRNVTH